MRKFDVAYYAASCDTLEDNTKFAQSLELDYPILADADCGVARAYGVASGDRKYPSRWTFYIGKDGKLLYVDRQVKTGSAGADIAARLGELGVAQAGAAE